ncbi:MAG: hypothetical protein KatS3mg132_749 [Limisphaera sp.]|nr:MAG: hypothetical protein KatS3mg132_749 [Limisphaera sp.]
MQWNDTDLKFVVETVVTRRRDHDRIVELVRDKPDLVAPLLDDPRLSERLRDEKEPLARISPRLLFTILLRRLRRDLADQGIVYEREGEYRLPVFAGSQARDLLDEPGMFDYLVDLLCSFVRTHSGTVYWKERGFWRKRKFSDMDLDDMVALCHLVAPEWRPRLYRRIGDIALFLSGVFPDHLTRLWRGVRRQLRDRRTLADYEREGRYFYRLAAQQAEPAAPVVVLERLAEQFTLAREILTTLSDRYLRPLREQYFAAPRA